MGLIKRTAHRAMYYSSAFQYRNFVQAARNPEAAQKRILKNYLRCNSDTAFGSQHGFQNISDVSQYSSRVPLGDYDSFSDHVKEIASGKQNVLTRAGVKLLEPTSGGTAASKLIPYTTALQREFSAAIGAWIFDLYRARPELCTGSAYWSVSPVGVANSFTESGLQVGFETDSQYLGNTRKRLIDTVMAVPDRVRMLENMETFRYATLFYLLHREDLSLISVWSPTFLDILVARLTEWSEQLIEDVRVGKISKFTSPSLPEVRPHPKRAEKIKAAFTDAGSVMDLHQLLWPNLSVISCWSDASSAIYARKLRPLFPQAVIQPKGLIATEGIISFPLWGQNGCALALTSHYLEFIPADTPSQDKTILAHQLEIGGKYIVVVTTGGGLYRYRLGDVIEVTGYFHNCPLVKFIGREDFVSDFFGERLNERHVSEVVGKTLAKAKIKAEFAMMAFESNAGRYRLFLELPWAFPVELGEIEKILDHGLRENFHYDYCRRAQQLKPAEIIVVKNAWGKYAQRIREMGVAEGDIKSVSLSQLPDWKDTFEIAVITDDACA